MEFSIEKWNSEFWNYVSHYDMNNSNILRKMVHSFTVAESCFAIASALKLTEYDKMLAYLAGLLHDVGRFEQWKRYQTYNDKISKDHGDVGGEVLENKSLFSIPEQDYEVIYDAVRLHTRGYDGKNTRTALFHEIIQNADAYSNVVTAANGSQPMTKIENGYTPEILKNFLELKGLWMFQPKTKLDRALMLTANPYYVRYDFLREDILRKNYIDTTYDLLSKFLTEEDKNIYKAAVENLKQKLNAKIEQDNCAQVFTK